MANRKIVPWHRIRTKAMTYVQLMRETGARAVRGEGAAEAYRRGQLEGYQAGAAWGLLEAGAVRVLCAVTDEVDAFAVDATAAASKTGPGPRMGADHEP